MSKLNNRKGSVPCVASDLLYALLEATYHADHWREDALVPIRESRLGRTLHAKKERKTTECNSDKQESKEGFSWALMYLASAH
jgi:hypothetical protein